MRESSDRGDCGKKYWAVTVVAIVAGAAVLAGAMSAQAAGPVGKVTSLTDKTNELDFPAMCVDTRGTPWVAYTEWDGKADTLRLARKTDAGLTPVAKLAGPGVIHRPTIACDGKGMLWVIWSQVNDKNVMDLHAARIDSKVASKDGARLVVKPTTLATSPGADIFPDAGTDSSGRVWVAWQSFRNGYSDIYLRSCDAGAAEWNKEIRVTTNPLGDWEPKLAFGPGGAVAVAFDSCRDGVYNVYLARISAKGMVTTTRISNSPRYEARASIAASADGRGYWMAWESGRENWGGDTRGVNGSAGLNYGKRVAVAYVDAATGKATEIADPTEVVRSIEKTFPKPPVPKKKGGRKTGAEKVLVFNLPKVATDSRGRVWLAVRYYSTGKYWRIALVRYDDSAKAWSQPTSLPDSSFSQDRNCNWAGSASLLAWPSDKRTSIKPGICGVYLAKIDTAADMPAYAGGPAKPAKQPADEHYWGEDTPQRTRSDRHYWMPAGTKYGLYWGDFHRHTDISVCRPPDDGCIVELYRYAYDVGRLDFAGPTDHTDLAKVYTPYEWWCDQKLADTFYSPGIFTPFYAYEREQRWPWGHRNVIFLNRNAPMVYIKRPNYFASPWQAIFPVAKGTEEITPQELWKVLRKYGQPLTVISHTGATGMGTDWDGYKEIDNAVENVVEIYQGARVSYEGIHTPQPTVGFPKNKTLKVDAHGSVKAGKDFGRFNKGVYQNALANGWKLGVFASSDHISTNVSFGGVYTEDFSRAGILDAINARRTIAGTDKIFIEFSCNGHLLGSIFETAEKPALKIAVNGTAKLKAVTIVRNETDYKRFTPGDTKDFSTTFTDASPVAGENRYYIRVEQVDGNMGWASPVWVTYKGK